MRLSNNPELKRLLWAQSTWLHLASLFALPFLLCVLLVMSEGVRDLERAAMWLALWWVVLVLGAIGCLRVAQSMAGEVHSGTWDSQCMSGIDAGRFVFGKVAGATIWLWLSAVVACGVAILIGDEDLQEKLIIPPLLFGICLTGHLATLAAATAMSSGARPGQRGYGMASAFLGWLVGIALLIIIAPFPDYVWEQHVYATDPWPQLLGNNQSGYRGGNWRIKRIIEDGPFWFSVSTHAIQFKAAILLLGSYFAGFAAWRLMRREFRHVESPIGAPLFMFAVMVFGLGVLPDFSQIVLSRSTGGSEAFVTFWFYAALLLYGMMVIEKRDQVQMMRLSRKLYGDDRGGKLSAQIPGWVWSLSVFAMFALFIYPAIMASSIAGNSFLMNRPQFFGGFIGAMMIYAGPALIFCMRMLRDALILSLAAGRKKRTKQGMDWVGPALLGALFFVEFIIFGMVVSGSSATLFTSPTRLAGWAFGFSIGAGVYFTVWLVVLAPMYRNKLKSLLNSIKAPARTISAEKP
ncbi:MAG: hypothetical protein Alpg2KO_29560 [Alphaproteobacteria bacterium]